MTRFSIEVFPPRTPDGLASLADTVTSCRRSTRCSSRSPTAPAAPTASARSTPSPHRRRHWRRGRRSPDLRRPAPSARSTPCSTATSALGVRNVVALRGDPPEGVGAGYSPHPDGYQRTATWLPRSPPAAGSTSPSRPTPRRHPQSPSIESRPRRARRQGRRRAPPSDHPDVLRQPAASSATATGVRPTGIDVALVPGIFPIHSFAAVARFAERCGAAMPACVAARFDGIEGDPMRHADESPPTSPPSRSPSCRPKGSTTSICTRSTVPNWCWPCTSDCWSRSTRCAHDDDAFRSVSPPNGSWCSTAPAAPRSSRWASAESDLRGERFADHGHSLDGNNDLLVLTQPDADRRPPHALHRCRRRHHHHQHVLVDRRRPARVRPRRPGA